MQKHVSKKWCKNDQKWCQNGAKMAPKSIQNPSKKHSKNKLRFRLHFFKFFFIFVHFYCPGLRVRPGLARGRKERDSSYEKLQNRCFSFALPVHPIFVSFRFLSSRFASFFFPLLSFRFLSCPFVCFCIPLHTFAYFCVPLHIPLHTFAYFCILLHTFCNES